jgi:hypothetical protein
MPLQILERPGEESAGGRGVSVAGEQHIDDLATLVDRAVDVAPGVVDLDVGLVDEPAVAGRVAGKLGGGSQEWRESLHPP